MDPNKSLTTSSDTKGKKKKKDRITVALCCNADGSEKIKPFVIGRSLNPMCFKNFSVQLYVDYKANKKAWMTSFLFADFLISFNAKMKRGKRKVLLIMDNAPSHILPQLSNVNIHFLPPTTTSHLQPLDAGIIQNFKCYYRKFQLKTYVDCLDANKQPEILLSEAIRFIKHAWDNVSSQTIVNCWRHTRLFIDENEPTLVDDSDSYAAEGEITTLLQRVYHDLEIDDDMQLTVREFIECDKNCENFENVTEEMIMATVAPSTESDTDETESEDSEDGDEEPVPTASEARSGLHAGVLRLFLRLHARKRGDLVCKIK